MKVVRSALLLLALSGFAYAQERTTRSPNPTGEIISQTAPTAAETAATPLAKLVGEAEQSNPEIQAAQHTWKAATNVPKQVSALPETQLFIQHFSVGSPRPFAGFTNSEFAYIGIGGSQDIPYPGKRALRGQVAELEANSLHEDSESVRRRVVETLKLVYYRLAYIQQTLGILQRNDQLLKQIQQVIESRYGVGHGNQQDVLRAQLQHTKILQDIAMHHQDEGQLEAQLKQILNRPQTSPEIVAEPLAPTPFEYSDAELLQRAEERNPDVRARSEMVRREKAQVELAHKEFRPDFNVQYEWERTDPTQFRAYYMATFGIRLPNRRRQTAQLAEAEEKRAGAEQTKQAEVQRVLSEIEQQYVFMRTSEERLKIYREGLVPQSEATFRAGLAAYESNRQDFETLLSNFLDVLNLDLQYRQELSEHESALARLERLAGVTLP